MARPNKLQKFVQRSDMFEGKFEATKEFALEAYEILNRYVFDNGLEPCPITVRRTKGVWGMCDGRVENDEFRVHEIILAKKFPFKAVCVAALAHEMVHHQQNDRGDLRGNPEEGESGSPWEDEANAKAGSLVRKFGEDNPEIYDL